MTTDAVTTTVTDHVALVELCRPPNNYFDESLLRDLADALFELDQDPGVRSVVLCSAGKHRSYIGPRDFRSDRP